MNSMWTHYKHTLFTAAKGNRIQCEECLPCEASTSWYVSHSSSSEAGAQNHGAPQVELLWALRPGCEAICMGEIGVSVEETARSRELV
jgi:hypothetical protein